MGPPTEIKRTPLLSDKHPEIEFVSNWCSIELGFGNLCVSVSTEEVVISFETIRLFSVESIRISCEPFGDLITIFFFNLLFWFYIKFLYYFFSFSIFHKVSCDSYFAKFLNVLLTLLSNNTLVVYFIIFFVFFSVRTADALLMKCLFDLIYPKYQLHKFTQNTSINFC